jgi:hypothetical protein
VFDVNCGCTEIAESERWEFFLRAVSVCYGALCPTAIGDLRRGLRRGMGGATEVRVDKIA